MLSSLSLPHRHHHHHHHLLPLNPTTKTLSPHLPFPRHPHRHRHRHRPICTMADPPSPEATFPDSAIRRISDKLRRLGFLEEGEKKQKGPTAGEIFVPTPRELPRRRVGHTLDPSWSTLEGKGKAPEKKEVGRAPPPTAAEVLLGAKELRKLRTVGIEEKRRLKVGKAGITEGIVNAIHERWRSAEVVKIKCEDLCRMNMKRTHEILERKTGGLVVWRSGSTIVLYRGVDYKYPYFTDDGNIEEDRSLPTVPMLSSEQGENSTFTSETNSTKVLKTPHDPPLVMGVGSPKKLRFQLPGEAQLAAEADQLLDGLGPRFTAWWVHEPLPVDADLLPGVVPGFRRPFRLLPFGVQPKLTDREMTILRRLARPLPCHFALGRNRNLQGLAASMIKLWERCEIAKIAIKRGVQNIDPELMAEEIKQLTGGTLLSRDKDYIVFYRGKDFLPLAVSHAIEERRNNMLRKRTDEHSSTETRCPDLGSSELVTVESFQEANSQNLSSEGERSLPKSTAKSLEVRLSTAIAEKEKAEKILEELEGSEDSPKPEAVKESIGMEERYMLKKVGLRMKPFLLLGRLGAFDGTVENMHLHWKYRELVKIIARNRPAREVHATARTLEAASGGILVGVERLSRGYAIIMYRGKNYKRPASLRPSTLLNKREAQKQYLEYQRCESSKLHVLKLNQDMKQMKHNLAQPDKEEETAQSTESDHSKAMCMSFNNSAELAERSSDKDEESRTASSSGSTDCNETLDVKTADDDLSASEEELSSISGNFKEKISKHDTSPLKGLSIEAFSKDSLDRDKKDTSYTELASGTSSRASILSNKERLILRKQALKMRKRPVLAVGKNNVITGVAKAINVHFRKHPLAIVNIKGVTKGTSVQDVISELEKATASVLVSREPNKVILYRGWGGGEEPGGLREETIGNAGTSDVNDITPRLLDAIKMESGLRLEQDKEAFITNEHGG